MSNFKLVLTSLGMGLKVLSKCVYFIPLKNEWNSLNIENLSDRM